MITIKDVSKLNPAEIAMTASAKHIQSVIEDLIICVQEAEYNALRKESSEWLKNHDNEIIKKCVTLCRNQAIELHESTSYWIGSEKEKLIHMEALGAKWCADNIERLLTNESPNV